MILLARPSCTNESLYYGIRCLATQISDTGKTVHFSENASFSRSWIPCVLTDVEVIYLDHWHNRFRAVVLHYVLWIPVN